MFGKGGLFFSLLALSLAFLFRAAFSINFFQDDYFFLKISKANNIVDILKFYSPFHEYSYKPLATETFYFLLHVLQKNVFIGHLIVFVVYFIGIIFLYKVIVLLMRNILLARLTAFLYAISFIHVFQLYWFATFQEVAMFAFLAISFYSFLKDRLVLFILFFALAALCKETAVLYAPFVVFFTIAYHRGDVRRVKKHLPSLITLAIFAVFFWFIYRYSLSHVTALDNYKIEWHPRLVINNAIWHFIWVMGFPNFMPDYFSSFFSQPIPAFWEAIKTPFTKTYLSLLLLYLSVLVILLVRVLSKIKNLTLNLLFITFCLVSFFMFLGPILFFLHKWMIRLSLPLIFISVLQGWILWQSVVDKNKYIKYLGMFALILYMVWNYFGVQVHQITSTYTLESSIYLKANQYFNKHKSTILNYDVIYLKDTSHNLPKGWNGSEKLKNSFSGDNFLDHFFPEKKMKVIYGFENKNIPKDAYVLESNLLL